MMFISFMRTIILISISIFSLFILSTISDDIPSDYPDENPEIHFNKLSRKANSIHRSNTLKNINQSSLSRTGRDVVVVVRDAGMVGPHIDFKGRITNISNSSGFPDHHEDLVAGCIGGAGNLNPIVEGMAPHASIFTVQYNPRFDRIDTTLGLHKYHGAVISNTSYGDQSALCSGGYNQNAHNVDKQLFENPTLMHVFASGNSGGTDCGNGYGTEFGNLEGGHLTAKNGITVGSVTPFGTLSGFSSRGPTQDKRLKPDLLAMGQDYMTTFPPHDFRTIQGTSFSSPAVAGIMAQLYQGYKDLNQGANPPSALIKSVMCNTAEDLGNSGPDYKHGFGLVNAKRAYESLVNSQYLMDSLQVLASNSHNLQIPAGISEVRVMLYWPDKEATAGSTKGLITDLDLSLTDTSSNQYLPLVLDPSPNTISLNRPAQPGVDTLNNIEQVVIKNPQAGTYQIHVTGADMPVGKTGYYLTWFFFEDEIEVTFPYGNESFTPQEDVIIRWDAYSDTGTFDVDYTLNNGQSWTSIASGVNGALRYQSWQTPNQVSGQVRIRVSRGGQVSESKENFTIIKTPSNLQFARVCQDFVTLTWGAVPGATDYDIFVLGEMYMDSVGTTSNTFFEPKIRYQKENWFSVRARGTNGIVGRRAIAVVQDSGVLVNCAGVAPTALFGIDTILCDSQVVYLNDSSIKSPDVWTWEVSPSAGVSFIQKTTNSSSNPVLSFTDTGIYEITLIVVNQFGRDTISKTAHIKNCSVSINDPINNLSIKVSPNPTIGKIRLQINDRHASSYHVQIVDIHGKQFYYQELIDSGNYVDETFDFHHLPSGIYFLRVFDGKSSQTIKLVFK